MTAFTPGKLESGGGYLPSRRFSSRSTASRRKSDRFSPTFSAASIFASVPPGKRAGVCSSLMRGLPTVGRLADISFCAKPCIFLISPIDRQSDISYLDDIRFERKQAIPFLRRFSMFSRSASFVKTVAEWKARSPRRSVDAAARAYAKRHMAAVVMCGDDSAVTYLYDAANDRVSRKDYPRVEWAA